MKFPRASGILLHPTSLPNEFGIGDFGKAAYEFVDFMSESKQTYWQVLPLGPTGFGDSPYQSFSSFAGNTNLISPELLVEEELLTEDEINDRPYFKDDAVEYGKVIKWKKIILEKAYKRFSETEIIELRESFEIFSDNHVGWLNDYALFRAIKLNQNQKPWFEWDETLRSREANALHFAKENLFEQIQAEKFYQFLFFKQWEQLKEYANQKAIKIIGDIPIFVSLDSADVWCKPKNFKLNEDLTPKVVAGVPPDYFSKTGQLWGNPIYDWNKMRSNDFNWWVLRMSFALKTFDILRIDHFRGFGAVWEVPGKDKTAKKGKWVNVPGKELFETLTNKLGELPVVAEDLGEITSDIEKLRDDFGFPGMRILQFGFGGDANSLHLPHNYINHCVAYTGTHDNDTTVGWFDEKNNKGNSQDQVQMKKTKGHCIKYLNSEDKEIEWAFIRAIWSSVADMAITPMQDVLGLGNNARMNLPATKSGNWKWRCSKDSFSEQFAERLKKLTELYSRA